MGSAQKGQCLLLDTLFSAGQNGHILNTSAIDSAHPRSTNEPVRRATFRRITVTGISQHLPAD